MKKSLGERKNEGSSFGQKDLSQLQDYSPPWGGSGNLY
jgi:hypothetical protein